MVKVFKNQVLLASIGAVAISTTPPGLAQTLNLSDLPLTSTSVSVPSNVVVTMDDSGSMAWGAIPDAARFNWNTRAYRSPNYNKVYYDPDTTYFPPKDESGVTQANANFNAAVRGYYYSSGNQQTYDLQTQYAAIYEHYHSRAPDLMESDEVAAFGCQADLCTEEAAYYYEFNDDADCTGTDSQKLISDTCYDKVTVTDASHFSSGTNKHGRTLDEEKTNFANWFQYYGIRGDAAKTSLMRAFVPENVDSQLRVGRVTINDTPQVRSGTLTTDNRIAELDIAERARMYSWIENIETSGSTPLRRAIQRVGEYFKLDNAYLTQPDTNSGDLAGCRVNSHIVVTDGFYNGSFTSPTDSFDLDQNNVDPLPDTSEVYTASQRGLYTNSNDSQSIADLAFHYWVNDLRPGTGAGYDNNIRPYTEQNNPNVNPADFWDPRNDPATWQHVNMFAIAYGAEGTLSADEATLNTWVANNSAPWPASSTNSPTSIDDLYHGTINSRGKFFNASTPDEFADALRDIFDRIPPAVGTVNKVGSTSGQISSGTNLFIARFTADNWSGDLEAYTISDGTGEGAACNSLPLGTSCSSTPVWSADTANLSTDAHVQPAARRIFTYDPTETSTATGAAGRQFLWSDLNSAQQALLNGTDGLGEQRVNYLRGDTANELVNGGKFRTRVADDNGVLSRVGPILHSLPVYVGPAGSELEFRFPDDLEGSPYAIAARHPLVYVGANDGMLHAYDAETGEEAWAYVPNAVIENLPELTEPTFTEGAYVDGFIDVQDAFIDSSWRTLLAGGLRSGGKGVYLLDVTDAANPGATSQTSASDHVRWEFTNDDDADLGYTYGQPVIVKSNYQNGEWVVLVPSGYNSTENPGATGRAYLYVLSAKDGSMIAKIDTGVGSTTVPNGLSSAIAVSDADVNTLNTYGSDGTYKDTWTADYAYAGDLQGNLWKFNLSDQSPANWTVQLLMNTGTSQPITAQPAVGAFPTRNPNSNGSNDEIRFVYFGTGQLLEPSDVKTTSQQTYYTVIDDDNCTSTPCVSAGQLVEQTIGSNDVLSNNAIDPVNDKGCFINLSTSGASERIIDQPTVVGQTAIFNTIQPDGDICEGGSQGSIFAVNRFTCGSTVVQVLDYNSDGTVDASDQLGNDIRSRIVRSTKSPRLFSGPKGNPVLISPDSVEQLYGDDRRGRVRWRQIK